MTRLPSLKAPMLILEKKLSKRSEVETVERRTFPDPSNNLDEEDQNISNFGNPQLMKKWLCRAHGNNEFTANIYKLAVLILG